MSETLSGFEIFLPAQDSDAGAANPVSNLQVRKFAARLLPGKMRYELKHGLKTEHVIVQTRIAGNVREGGISILDENTVCLTFGGPLNEPLDVVVIG